MVSIFSVWLYMTENTKYVNLTRTCLSLKRLSCIALLCPLLLLSGCGLNLPSLPTLPSWGSSDSKDANDLADSADALEDEISYIDQRKPKKRKFNPKNMFGKSLRSPTERMDRLERAVQDMRNEFDQVQPSISRLTALESEIQKLVRELKALNNGNGSSSGGSGVSAATNRTIPSPSVGGVGAASNGRNRPSPARKQAAAPTPKTAPAPKKTYQKKIPPNVAGGAANIFDVRIGEHPNRTRIVMDVSSKTSFNVDIDNNEKIAVIELPNAVWSASKAKTLAKSNFVSSYTVETAGDGHILILQLKRNAKVTYKDDLKGNSGGSRRLVIDLSGA